MYVASDSARVLQSFGTVCEIDIFLFDQRYRSIALAMNIRRFGDLETTVLNSAVTVEPIKWDLMAVSTCSTEQGLPLSHRFRINVSKKSSSFGNLGLRPSTPNSLIRLVSRLTYLLLLRLATATSL